jgi:hypothetical protein
MDPIHPIAPRPPAIPPVGPPPVERVTRDGDRERRRAAAEERRKQSRQRQGPVTGSFADAHAPEDDEPPPHQIDVRA